MKVIWSKMAKESLAQIYDYIFEDSPQNAEMVFNTLLELGDSLSDEKVEYAKDLIINEERFRTIPKWSYKIIYERRESSVIILDIFNTYRNPKRLRRYK
jgi:plasmid stabilization system protein ParE